jgi:alpha-N-arabinofuranosidase
MTNANGLYRQTIYYPYSWGLQMAQGDVLNLLTDSPVYEVKGIGNTPYLDAVATVSKESGNIALFVLNRDLSNAHEIDVVWEDQAPRNVAHAMVLTGSDLKAFNSFSEPKRVVPTDFTKPITSGGHTKFEVPPRSYNLVQWSI